MPGKERESEREQRREGKSVLWCQGGVIGRMGENEAVREESRN